MFEKLFFYKILCGSFFVIFGLSVFFHASVAYGACANFSDDVNFINNYPGGFTNAKNYPNSGVFSALKSDGSILAWGNISAGGLGAPTDSGYTKIYSGTGVLAALKSDGSITAWGDDSHGGVTDAPVDSGYTSIYSSQYTFAALKSDGSIATWGTPTYTFSLTAPPTGGGYTELYSAREAFAALKSDSTVTSWGYNPHGGLGAPTDSGYVKIYSAVAAFAALKSDGSITAWGSSSYGGAGAPTDNGYVDVETAGHAFAALKSDGSITAWGYASEGGSGAPTDSSYIEIHSTGSAFAALKSDGSITAWGHNSYGGSGAPTDTGYIQIYANRYAFAALKSDGSITAWGSSSYGGIGEPMDGGYIDIYVTNSAFAALKSDGSITAWGSASAGGTGAPTDSGYTEVYSTGSAFAALKSDSSITAWGGSGGSGVPEDFCESLNDIIIPNPTPSQINTRVGEGYMTVDQGTIDSTQSTTTAVNVTYRTADVDAVFPTGTITTEAGSGLYNFENFTIKNITNTVKSAQPTSRVAFRLGVPNESLNFSQDITITVKVGGAFNGQALDILYQNEGESTWSTHDTCTVANGVCTFATDHATIYTINGEPSATGRAPLEINVEVQDTLSLDCYEATGVSGDHTVTLGDTITGVGYVTAGTPSIGKSTCDTTTNDDKGYYLTIERSTEDVIWSGTNGVGQHVTAANVMIHEDPHNNDTWYEINDTENGLSYFNGSNTQTWTDGTTKGFGFSVVGFPDTNLTNNTTDESWTLTGTLCQDGSTGGDVAQYAAVPSTPQTIAAVTQYEASQTSTDVCYKVDVLPSQQSGQYAGQVTFTAVTDASSYVN